MKQRLVLIDAAKGLGILLVVLGHAIQYNNLGFDNFWFRVIYSFHMPFFMFLSGCMAKYGNPGAVKNNVSRLVIPFIAWYIIGFFIKWVTSGAMPDIVQYIVVLLRSPDAGLWFLWVLFLCHVFLFILYKVHKTAGMTMACLLFLVMLMFPYGVLGLGLLAFHFVFFLGGYLAFKYKDSILKWRYYIVPAAIITYLILFPYWEFGQSSRLMSALPWLPGFIKSHPIIIERPFRIATAFSGIVIAISLTYLFIQIAKVRYLLSLTGLYTMEIYVSHLLFFFPLGYFAGIRVLTAFLMMLSASLILAYLLKQVAFTRTLLYGIPAKSTGK